MVFFNVGLKFSPDAQIGVNPLNMMRVTGVSRDTNKHSMALQNYCEGFTMCVSTLTKSTKYSNIIVLLEDPSSSR